MDISNDKVIDFTEKPMGDGGWINGGFFVLEPGAIDYIKGDFTNWEEESLGIMASHRQLSVFKHSGFWQAMDTLRDKNLLEKLWESGRAPWKMW